MKVLFISYFFEPSPVVGAKRMSYWAQNFKKHIPDAEVTLITTTPNPSAFGINKVYVVKPGKRTMLSYLFKDKGLTWVTAIKNELTASGIKKLDYVIISGSPFMQFGLSHFLKNKFGAKVVLDYRDPFAINPRFNNSSLKVGIKKYFETKFNKAADLIISVNQFCIELLAGYSIQSEKYKVIPNGFNETEMPIVGKSKKSNENLEVVYAGTFYSDRNPNHLLKVIEEREDVFLNHLGKSTSFLEGRKRVKEHGQKDYSSMLKLLSKMDLGLIITSGEAFEATTKIYDYIAMKIPILVITSGEFRTGSIGNDLKNYPTIWCKNATESIANALDQAKELLMDDIEVKSFSREVGLLKLLDYLQKI